MSRHWSDDELSLFESEKTNSQIALITGRTRVSVKIKRWCLKNPGKRKGYRDKWRLKNPERAKECIRAWKAANPRYYRAYRQTEHYKSYRREYRQTDEYRARRRKEKWRRAKYGAPRFAMSVSERERELILQMRDRAILERIANEQGPN